MKLLQRLGPVTLLEHEMVRVFPRAVGDIEDPALGYVGAGTLRFDCQRAQQARQITEINNVATSLNRFAKLRVGRENHSVANEDDGSAITRNLHVAADRAM